VNASIMAEPKAAKPARGRCDSMQDPAAFDAMVAREAPLVERLAGRLMLWRGDIEDVVQEVFVRAWSQRDQFRGDSMVSTWLCGITVNVCRSLRRRQKLWNLFLTNVPPRRVSFDRSDELEIAEKEFLINALERLRHCDRELIVLKWLEERTMAEIATMLGISHKAAEVRLVRARARLKKLMDRNHGPTG
jgi:RNA polymerase sigma-70 factor (ECF subfamily)